MRAAALLVLFGGALASRVYYNAMQLMHIQMKHQVYELTKLLSGLKVEVEKVQSIIEESELYTDVVTKTYAINMSSSPGSLQPPSQYYEDNDYDVAEPRDIVATRLFKEIDGLESHLFDDTDRTLLVEEDGSSYILFPLHVDEDVGDNSNPPQSNELKHRRTRSSNT